MPKAAKKVNIVNVTKVYLNDALHGIRQLSEDERLSAGGDLLARILEIEDEHQAAMIEIKVLLGLRARL